VRADHYAPSGEAHLNHETLSPSRPPVRDLKALVDDVVRSAVAAAAHGGGYVTTWEDGDPMRELCAAARANDVRAETLLLAIKDRWRRLPQSHGASRMDGEVTLAAVITGCIKEYYGPRRA
jgi:hypothetical protein